jgi:outer membrane protein insertion porin family
VQEREPEGVVLAYIVQEKPLLTQISFKGNTKIESRELRGTIASAVDQPLDEHKLFKDAERIQELYHQRGFTNAVVKYKTKVDEKTGRGTVEFEVLEPQ